MNYELTQHARDVLERVSYGSNPALDTVKISEPAERTSWAAPLTAPSMMRVSTTQAEKYASFWPGRPMTVS